jgi:hypothetical protein
MSTYLENLVTRTQATSKHVRPRLSPVFYPLRSIAGFGEPRPLEAVAPSDLSEVESTDSPPTIPSRSSLPHELDGRNGVLVTIPGTVADVAQSVTRGTGSLLHTPTPDAQRPTSRQTELDSVNQPVVNGQGDQRELSASALHASPSNEDAKSQMSSGFEHAPRVLLPTTTKRNRAVIALADEEALRSELKNPSTHRPESPNSPMLFQPKGNREEALSPTKPGQPLIPQQMIQSEVQRVQPVIRPLIPAVVPDLSITSPRVASQQTHSAPEIHVTIGHVEVRATVPAQETKSSRKAVSRVMGLEEYLGRRSAGGAR